MVRVDRKGILKAVFVVLEVLSRFVSSSVLLYVLLRVWICALTVRTFYCGDYR